MQRLLFQLVRRLRCELSLNHRWPAEPIIDGPQIIHVCQRCGKRVSRLNTRPH